MIPDLLETFSRSQREAVDSAGYRVMRWIASREVLQARVTKGRISGPLGDFLAHWLSLAPANGAASDLWLSFNYAQDRTELKLAGGSAALAHSSLEQALLHLPALRSFWSQELRQQHFVALRSLVPQSWLMDPAQVPPGSVIQGLNMVSWDRAPQLRGGSLEIKDPQGHVLSDRSLSQNSILTARPASGVIFTARYGRNDKGQVVLSSIEAAP